MRICSRVALIVGVLATTVPIARAGERPLDATEIGTLLSGNTTVGTADGVEWRQYFDAAGATIHVAGGEPRSQGRWRLQGDKYCSQWPPQVGWACYAVTGDPDASPPTLTWIGDSGTRYPATIAVGNALKAQ